MNNIDFHGIEEIWSSLSTSSLLWLTMETATGFRSEFQLLHL